MQDKFTLANFNKRFKTDEDCLEEIFNLRFPDGVSCITCKKLTKYYKLKGRQAYSCEFCRAQIYPLARTIFEKTTTPLKLWFHALFLMTQTRSGVSAKQLERMLGVTYKTAWRMWQQIRILMADTPDISLLNGTVEIDETFIGGKGWNRRYIPHFNEKPKEVVMGMIKRDGKAYLKHIENTGKWALIEQIDKHVSPKARIVTDQYAGYTQLKKKGFRHDVVNHNLTYVTKGDIHTQNAENVWSILKRGIYGVYRHVSKKYLQAYVDEYAFRYNYREQSGQMFDILLNQTALVSVLRKPPFSEA